MSFLIFIRLEDSWWWLGHITENRDAGFQIPDSKGGDYAMWEMRHGLGEVELGLTGTGRASLSSLRIFGFG